MHHTENAVHIPVSEQQIIDAVKGMKKEKRQAFIEDLLSIVSPEYLESIREARKDYKQGRTYSHDEVFGQ